MKRKKFGMEKGMMPLKSLGPVWRMEMFQTKYFMWNCSWLPWKLKINSAMDTSLKCGKVGMEEEIASND